MPAIFDAGTYDGGLYLVMELVEGCTIGDLLAEQGPLPVAWAAAIAGQVAAVLAIAHQRQILHRDIKPQNVMLTRDGTVKVLDFGVAGIISQRITSTGVTVGTPGYIAPEQLHNLPATPRTDLYALGCLLYEMLAGEPVFTATSPAGLMRMHLDQAPPPLRRRDVPRPLESLLWQLLDKDPASHRPMPARPTTCCCPSCPRQARWATSTPSPGPGPACSSTRACWQGSPQPVRPNPARRASRSAVPVQGARNDAGWTLRHSLWLLPALLFGGFGAWLSFGYIAARHKRLTWLAAAVAYTALTVVAVMITASGPDAGNGPLPASADIGVTLLAALWPVAIIHVLWVNFQTRLPLLRPQ